MFSASDQRVNHVNLVLPRSDTGDCPDQSIMAAAMLLIAHSPEYNEAGDLSVSSPGAKL